MSNITLETRRVLESVGLFHVKDHHSSSFSGGMKRRLSVALTILGNPQICFLDEPTTGLDPLSRRQTWKAIEDLKHNRVVVLTTHSMEEADVLGDEIAIMDKGRIRAQGTSLFLKNRFGAGYELDLLYEAGEKDVVRR